MLYTRIRNRPHFRRVRSENNERERREKKKKQFTTRVIILYRSNVHANKLYVVSEDTVRLTGGHRTGLVIFTGIISRITRNQR